MAVATVETEPTQVAASDVSPAAIVDAIHGFHKTAAMKAAIELDLFTAIGSGSDTAQLLAAETGGAERGLRVLCDFLTVNGFLTKSDARYALAPSAAVFLDRRSPAYMGSVVDFLAAPETVAELLDDPAAYVRNGGSLAVGKLAPDHPIWIKFAEAMIPFVAVSAEGARPRSPAGRSRRARFSTSPRVTGFSA